MAGYKNKSIAGFVGALKFIHKIPRILKSYFKVFHIFKVSVKDSEISKNRLKICKGCKQSKPSKIVKFINGKAEYEHSLVCTKCGCPCLEKSLVLSEFCSVWKDNDV